MAKYVNRSRSNGGQSKGGLPIGGRRGRMLALKTSSTGDRG